MIIVIVIVVVDVNDDELELDRKFDKSMMMVVVMITRGEGGCRRRWMLKVMYNLYSLKAIRVSEYITYYLLHSSDHTTMFNLYHRCK